MKQLIYILSLLILISCCSPQKRMARICKEHPELCQKETIKVRDTIIIKKVIEIPGITIDTTFWDEFTEVTDTNKPVLSIKKDNISVNIYPKKQKGSYRVNVQDQGRQLSISDTMVRWREIALKKPQNDQFVKKSRWEELKNYALMAGKICIVLIIIIVLYHLILSLKKWTK